MQIEKNQIHKSKPTIHVLEKRIVKFSFPEISDYELENMDYEKLRNLFLSVSRTDWHRLLPGGTDGTINKEYENSPTLCLGKHAIVDGWLIRHKKTGQTAHVGSECVERFDNPELLFDLKRELEILEELKKIYCEPCNHNYTKSYYYKEHLYSNKHYKNTN